IRIHGRPLESEPLYVLVRGLPGGGPQHARYDIQAFTGDGTLVWHLEDYRASLLWPLAQKQASRSDTGPFLGPRAPGPRAEREEVS
ncbi:MAG TPA: hypothetical protein VF815_36030, partial [Myxococcaceae bacterium]